MSEAPPSPEDREAAHLLRTMAAQPRQSIVWAMYHGCWSDDTLAALERGAKALEATSPDREAVWLREIADRPGEAVGFVAEVGAWYGEWVRAMRNAAELLDGQPG